MTEVPEIMGRHTKSVVWQFYLSEDLEEMIKRTSNQQLQSHVSSNKKILYCWHTHRLHTHILIMQCDAINESIKSPSTSPPDSLLPLPLLSQMPPPLLCHLPLTRGPCYQPSHRSHSCPKSPGHRCHCAVLNKVKCCIITKDAVICHTTIKSKNIHSRNCQFLCSFDLSCITKLWCNDDWLHDAA